MKDWIFRTDEYICDLRTVGVLVRDGKLLVQRDRDGSEYALPGGHIRIGETTADGLVHKQAQIKDLYGSVQSINLIEISPKAKHKFGIAGNEGMKPTSQQAIEHDAVAAINDGHIGQNPFTLDITDFVKSGENELTVCVWDPTEDFVNSRGKQCFKPRGCFYTRVSGIWQTVWMEYVPENYINSIKTENNSFSYLFLNLIIYSIFYYKLLF